MHLTWRLSYSRLRTCSIFRESNMEASTKKSSRGRPKLYSPGTKKQMKKLSDSSRYRINIGTHVERWNRLKMGAGLKSNEEFAGLLLDSYCSQQEQKKPSSPAPSTSCGPSQSTPVQASRVHLYGMNRPELSGISGSDSNEKESDISGVEELPSEIPSTVETISTTKRHESRYPAERSTKSSFINPFELTLYTSEEEDSEEHDSDPEYEPSFNISIGPLKQEEEIDVELEDVVFGIEEDGDVDETGTEESGPGIVKITSPEDVSLLTEDQLFLVYLQPLLTLAGTKIEAICRVESCCATVKTQTSVKGSAIYIIWICDNGHEVHKWCSQPVLNRRLHGGDILTSAAVLFSGNNFSKIRLFAKFLNLRIVNITQFNLIQRTYLVPSVDEMWAEKQQEVLLEFDGQDVVILGDGRMDSPGHCAQYCTYTVMENTTKKILSCITLDKRQCGGKSTGLEKLGFTKTMASLKDKEVKVVEVVTDAHMQISSVMKRQFKDIKHSYDLWHAAKNLGKKITKAGQDKSCKALTGWTKHVVNHFWYAAQTASSYDQFIGIWFGLIHHVVNEHQWILAYGSEGLNACSHGPLAEDSRNVEWLKKDSKAHKTLVEIIANKRLLNNIPYFLNARSTAELENFQNHILMYAAKRFSFTPPVYRARNLLAAIDYNEHIDRPPLVNKDGTQRYQRLFNKKSQRYSVFPVKTPKTFSHIPQLMTKVVRLRLEDRIGMKRKVVLEEEDPRRIAPTLAPVPPPTNVIVEEKKSRLGK